MNKWLMVVFIVSFLLFALGLFDSIGKGNGGAILISASILLASVLVCSKLEDLKHKK